MNRHMLLLASALVATSLAGAAFAQGTAGSTTKPIDPAAAAAAPATPKAVGAATTHGGTAMDPMKFDMKVMGGGVRSSRVVGMPVLNDANERIGSVEDMIMIPGDPAPYAVVSVGTYLGGGPRYMVVPYSMLTAGDKHMTLPKVSKSTIQSMPQFPFVAM